MEQENIIAFRGGPAPERRSAPDWAACAALPDALLPVLVAAQDAVVVVDCDGLVMGWNDGARRLLGWNAADAVGRQMAELIIPPRLREAHLAAMAKCCAQEHPIVMSRCGEFDALHRDGHELAVDMSIASGHDRGKPYFISFIGDAGERRMQQVARMRWQRSINHRLRNFLSQASSLAYLTARGESDPLEIPARFETRILALAKVHDLLATNGWRGCSLRVLFERFLSAGIATRRVALVGEDIDLGADQVLGLGVAINELHCNAIEHGALADREGRLTVSWTASEGEVVIEWNEKAHKPEHAERGLRGVGISIIDASIRQELEGEVRWFWRAEGLCARIAFALAKPSEDAMP